MLLKKRSQTERKFQHILLCISCRSVFSLPRLWHGTLPHSIVIYDYGFYDCHKILKLMYQISSCIILMVDIYYVWSGTLKIYEFLGQHDQNTDIHSCVHDSIRGVFRITIKSTRINTKSISNGMGNRPHVHFSKPFQFSNGRDTIIVMHTCNNENSM